MKTTNIPNRGDGETCEVWGGRLECIDDYHGHYYWVGQDSAGYRVDSHFIRARDGKILIGRWVDADLQYHLPPRIPGFTVYVTRFRPAKGRWVDLADAVAAVKRKREKDYTFTR